MKESAIENESFRDSISTISKEGKRAWIYPKKPVGKLYRARTIVGWILLTMLFSWPFIKVNGHPIMLLNIIERKFIIMGVAFWPQDFFLFVLAMMTFVVFIILFTVIFGRVWCGWACPQTIFMEMVFRKIEYLIEGDYQHQKRLTNSSWTSEKIVKKGIKHFIFFLIAFCIANIFLAYIISIDQLKLLVTDGPGAHMAGFSALVIFTTVFYLVYARFREQACIVVCPYGRLQGVLLDKNSIVITYDYKRGEPRGAMHKGEKREFGDCIDCHQCVQVCPTGIDIRNGTQLECVNCSACVDACDSIMQRIGFQKRLIRYDSEEGVATKTKFKITTRIIAYSVVLFLLLTTFITLLALRTDVEATILRTPGMMYQKLGDGKVSNLYVVQVINKTFSKIPVELRLKQPAGEIKYVGNGLKEVSEQGLTESEFFLILSQHDIHKLKTPVIIEVLSGNKVVSEVKTNFLGPNDAGD
ncbi:MAG: cytochrome c oxidase accessory protein CcoG [Bacteroidetes bacterium]|nr:cytochrome c oxidase accessory protein CcoG [Bacteroidota bacterium]